MIQTIIQALERMATHFKVDNATFHSAVGINSLIFLYIKKSENINS